MAKQVRKFVQALGFSNGMRRVHAVEPAAVGADLFDRNNRRDRPHDDGLLLRLTRCPSVPIAAGSRVVTCSVLL